MQNTNKLLNAHWWKTISWQYITPQHLLSYLMGIFCDSKCPKLKNWQIRRFIRRYGVNMEEALISDYREYTSFNHFFSRHLKIGARPIDDNPRSIISPSDGVLSQFGAIDNHTLVQAKGKFFTTQALLGSSSTSDDYFKSGHFATIYLAPKDYHRVHMPIAGTLKKMRFIPGDLFSVSTNTADNIDNLFARNERVVCFFDTEFGPLAIVMVGAMIVGSMATNWAGTVKSKSGKIEDTDYAHAAKPITLQKGDDLGYFHLGSTVIMLMGEENIAWEPKLQLGCDVQMGQSMAQSPHPP